MSARKKTPAQKNTIKSAVKMIGNKAQHTGKITSETTTSSKAPTRDRKTLKAAIPSRHMNAFPIVGIGASAGGLEAIEQFFAKMPANSGMAFVIVQHLDPKYKSIMASLLEKYTAMKIHEIKNNMKVEPNHIYLNPPNKDIVIMKGSLQLMNPVLSLGIRLPIDSFLRSLAEDQGERSACIILSGSGTDGTLGLKAIKSVGGITIVQEEKQAKYVGMPRSAIDTGLVDYILPVEKIPEELVKYAKHPYLKVGQKDIIAESYESHAKQIFFMIRSKTGHDLSDYKPTTIRRRIERRMALHQIEKLSDYVNYLQRTPGEVLLLFKDMLITVTNFFRDSEAFRLLKTKVLTELMKKKNSEDAVRIWVPGCATGEEAYSIAIILNEVMEDLNSHIETQIFATDIDEDVINFARQAVYPANIVGDVADKRLETYFIKKDNTYQVKQQIRERVIFAVQNLIKDPPFSKLDLIVCRNVLIYMNPSLQKKILPLFYYTLRPGGYLMLGPSESVGAFTDLFRPINSKWKIYRRGSENVDKEIPYPLLITDSLTDHGAKEMERQIPRTGVDVRRLVERILLDNYSLPCVLINRNYDIIFFHGSTENYLAPPEGEASFNILKMAREDLRYKLSNAIRQAMKQHKAVTVEGLLLKRNDQLITINLLVRPIVGGKDKKGLLLIVFDDTTQYMIHQKGKKKMSRGEKEETENPRIVALNQELQSTKEYLQTTIEELETSNEELKSTNEEMQSTNEELQSTNEELNTSKEELQSTNEELATVNAELQNKVDQLSQSQDDLNNLFSNIEVGVVFLDNNLNVKNFNQPATKIFNLIKTDKNRSIKHITLNCEIKDLCEQVKEAYTKLAHKTLDVQTADGTCYTLRISPYRTGENVVGGVIITIMDVTGTTRKGN